MTLANVLMADGPGWIVFVGIIIVLGLLIRWGHPANRGSGSRGHISGVDPDED